MSVENQIYEVFGTGNGSATVFSFSPMVLPDDSSQLVVTKVASDGTLTLLVEGVGAANYSVALLADAPSTGSVTYPATGATRLAVGERLHMQRVLTLEQKTELEDQGGYNPETQEAQFDRFVMIDLQQQEQLDRAPLVPIGSAVTVEELTDDLIALAAISDDISTVAANDANVTTVAGIDSDITTVAGIAAGVMAVAAIDSDVTQVSTIHANVTTVAGDHSSVVTVASDHAYLATVASDHAYLATVAGDHAAIAAIYADLTKVNGVYDDLTKINGVYDDLTKVNGVYDDLTAIDSAYTNLAAITAAPTQAANAAASASAASTSAGNALTYSNLAASILASAPLRDQVNYTSSDSPITIGATHNGKWVLIDTSGGNVTVNMTAIATLGEPFDVQITSKAGSNSITVNRGSTDVFYVSGASATSVSITAAGTGGIFSADATPLVTDEWDVALIGYSPVTQGNGILVSGAQVSADFSDQSTAETGTSTVKVMSPLRVANYVAFKIGSTLQAWAAKLDVLAALTWAADKVPYFTSASAAATASSTSYGRGLWALADQAALQTAVGLSSPVVQQVRTETGAMATGSTAIPCDDTVPQNTEGTQFMSLAITPTSATNILVIEVVANFMDSTAGGDGVIALFQDSTASAIAAVGFENGTQDIPNPYCFTHKMVAGTTSATTFKVRIGDTQGGTITFNGSAGARKLGGVMASSIVITEWKA